jgi:hypothetical protein
LPNSTKQELKTLNVKNVIIIGGTGVVSLDIKNTLEGMGISTKRVYGQDRYETSVNVAKELGNVNNAFVLNGEDWKYALTMAPIAYKIQAPILLIEPDGTVPNSVSNCISSYHNVCFNIVGNLEFTNKTRMNNYLASTNFGRGHYIEGNDLIDIVKSLKYMFENDMDLSSIYLANDSNFVDALSGSALAGQNGNPIILVGTNNENDVNKFINDNNISNVTLLGGAAYTTSIDKDSQATDLLVSSVSVISATDLQVKFNSLPDDISKVLIKVTREGIPVALTTSWDSTGTLATLSYSSNLPEGTYAVDIKNNTVDLGSTNVSVTAQKVAKIEITSTILGVSAPINSSGITVGGNGYATYKVLDQYGNDITASALAQNITWICGVGNVTANNGLLIITPYNGDFLTHYTTLTITGVYEATGVTTSNSLTVP